MNANREYGIRKLREAVKNGKLKDELTDENILKPGRYADCIAKDIQRRRDFNANQLRKVFAQIMEIKTELDKGSDKERIATKVWELYPRLAYARGRELIPKEFYELLVDLLGEAEEDIDIAKKVVKLIQSIVAYYRFHKLKS